ncbi:hypothetical protein [Pedobacter agri]|uniref:hypothetical protein n=1 Tax=Pedobacter agri TaxID=454586 RepID=UPI00292DCB3E|nr:hypothetical protein [Pedobacter agri]
MTVIEIKQEINRALEHVPERLLIDILDLIKEVQAEKSTGSNLASNLKKILSEDNDLLHKLAQ